MMENIKLPKFSSVVKVGDGRGFVFDQKARPPGWDRPELKKLGLRPFALRRCIITAAHCLPHFPEPHAWESFDRVYPDLLGALGGKPSVWALLLFADPVANPEDFNAGQKRMPHNQVLAGGDLKLWD